MQTHTIKWKTKLHWTRQLILTQVSFLSHSGSKRYLYSSSVDDVVNILCAIWYYLVSETINYTPVCPIWLTQPSLSGLLCCYRHLRSPEDPEFPNKFSSSRTTTSKHRMEKYVIKLYKLTNLNFTKIFPEQNYRSFIRRVGLFHTIPGDLSIISQEVTWKYAENSTL